MNARNTRYVFTRERVRAVDQRALEEYHIPSIVLMENAALGLTRHAMEMLGRPERTEESRAVIVCGGGNNGSDVMAAARHLTNAGVDCTLILAKPPDSYTGDAATNLNICRAMRIPTLDASEDPDAALSQAPEPALVIDGLLGTGLTSEVRGSAVRFIEWINNHRRVPLAPPILAIDIPSGLDCDTGEPLGPTVRANRTVTFVGWKKGFLNPAALRYTGAIHVAPIGAPQALIEELGEPMR